MFARFPRYAKQYLLPTGVGILALVSGACSQAPEPVANVERISPQVVSTRKVVKPPPRKQPGKVKTVVVEPAVVQPEQTPVVEITAPAPAEPQPASLPAPAPAEAAEGTPVPAPVTSPAEEATPFVPAAPGKRIAQLSVPGPYVAVTFDDGPHATLTPQVLDIFNRHGARATFFVLGQNAKRHRSLLARAVAEGHEIGSHTWSHINMCASSTDKIISELDRTAAVIEDATGSRPRVMRPPYGATNKELVNMVYKRYGTPSILWDSDTEDWRKPGVQIVIDRALNMARPGSIILLHDIHPSTIAAVEGIVTGLQARGFQLVTVSELISMAKRAAGVAEPVEVPAASATTVAEATQSGMGAASIGVPPGMQPELVDPEVEAEPVIP